MKMPEPNSTKELKRVLGFFSYYSKWIENVSQKAYPIIHCKHFPLSGDALKSFQDLKSDLAEASLGVINDDLPFEV